MHYSLIFIIVILDVYKVLSFLIRCNTYNAKNRFYYDSDYRSCSRSALANPNEDFHSLQKEKFDFKLSLLLAGFSFEAYNDEDVSGHK